MMSRLSMLCFGVFGVLYGLAHAIWDEPQFDAPDGMMALTALSAMLGGALFMLDVAFGGKKR